MRGIARIVAADHDHQIERLGDQLEHGILPLLRRRADRVEGAEMLAEGLGAPAPRQALPHLAGDRQRFARQHGRLIRYAHPLQVPIRIEIRRHLPLELPEELLLAPRSPLLAFDVLADNPGLSHVPDYEVLPTRILVHLTRRGLGLFVVVLAVDDCGETIARVHLDALPHVQDRAARRIYEHAPDCPQPVEVPHRHAERRQDHDVVGRDGAEVELGIAAFRAVQELDAHRLELVIDVRVVDDLADEEREIAGVQRIARRPDGIHHPAVIVGRQRAFDGALEAESFPEVGLFHGTQSNCTPRPPRIASSTRCTCHPSRNVAGSPWGAPPRITCTISRSSRTNDRAHMLFGLTFSQRSSGAEISSSGPPDLPSSRLVSPLSSSVPSLPVTWPRCPGPCCATVLNVIVATAPLAVWSTQLAKSSAVTGCIAPVSSLRCLTNVSTNPATYVISLPLQNRKRSARCDPTAPRIPPPRDASNHQLHGASAACGRPSPRRYGLSDSSTCRSSPIALDRISSRARRRLGSYRNSWSIQAILSGCCSDAVTICAASKPSIAIGFSHSTCFPASNAAIAYRACVSGVDETITRSTSA